MKAVFWRKVSTVIMSKPLDTRRLPEVVERFLREGRRARHA